MSTLPVESLEHAIYQMFNRDSQNNCIGLLDNHHTATNGASQEREYCFIMWSVSVKCNVWHFNNNVSINVAETQLQCPKKQNKMIYSKVNCVVLAFLVKITGSQYKKQKSENKKNIAHTSYLLFI